jgi:hypothetical protein
MSPDLEVKTVVPGWRWLWVRMVSITSCIAVASGLFAFYPAGVQAMAAEITISIDPQQAVSVSQYATGLTHVDSSLTRAQAGPMAAARAVVAQSAAFQNNHLMAWGTGDPWPDPSQPGPTNWASLDRRLALALESGATPMLTLAEAPWWMKGQRQADGSTKLIPSVDGDFKPATYAGGFTDFRGLTYPAGYESPSPYDARILDNQMDNWLRLVEATAERYMTPPYNVRYFQVWNELKGYHNRSTNQWDYDNSPGDPTGYQAQHGYTSMYNQVYARLHEVARRLGIPEGELRIGGPYVAFKTWPNPAAGGFPATEPRLQNRPYGTFDQRDVDAIKYWLQHKVGAEFIAWDGGTKNREGTNLVGPFVASERFGDTVAWLRSLDPAVYPGADTLPVAYSEWYAFPYDTVDPQQHAAVKTYAAMLYIRAGGWLTLLWGGEASNDPKLNASLYTRTDTAGGGQALPWAGAYQALRMHFSAGTVLVATTQSTPEVGVLASAAKTLLINKTGRSLSAAVNTLLVTLNPYQVLLIDTPPVGGSATPVPPTATQTALPTATATDTPAPTASPTATQTLLPTVTHTASPTATNTASPTATETAPPTATLSSVYTATPQPDGSPPARRRHLPRLFNAAQQRPVARLRPMRPLPE